VCCAEIRGTATRVLKRTFSSLGRRDRTPDSVTGTRAFGGKIQRKGRKGCAKYAKENCRRAKGAQKVLGDLRVSFATFALNLFR